MTDYLVDFFTNNDNEYKYNLIIEWGMRKPEAPLETIEKMHNKGYYTTIIFIAVEKDKSLEACNYRDTNNNDLVRCVSTSFHELCIKELPISAKTIYEEGTSKGIINNFKVIYGFPS